MRRLLVLLAMTLPLPALFVCPAFAQQPAPGSTTAANPDGTITFRYRNSGAQAVSVQTDAAMQPIAMQKDASGLWTATSAPLKPEYYSYSFDVDGTSMLDPLNRRTVPNLLGLSSSILVPGSVPQPWEDAKIPHGNLTRFLYSTRVGQNLPQDQEPYIVYTPPGYDAQRPEAYPVLYLLHGWSDTAEGWTAVGRAQFILDSLLAQGKIVPMVVVMPQGYGDFHFVTTGHDVWNDPTKVDDNVNRFSDMMLEEIMPAVERDFHVAKDRDHRAIAGLSMGGLESLTIGLTHAELFSYVVGMSSAIHGDNFQQHFPVLAANDAASTLNLKLLWIGCGTQDHLLPANQKFAALVKAKGLPVQEVEVPGQHTWLVWRQNLLTVAPLLFR